MFQSPISRNQEVSAFGEQGDGDTGMRFIFLQKFSDLIFGMD